MKKIIYCIMAYTGLTKLAAVPRHLHLFRKTFDLLILFIVRVAAIGFIYGKMPEAA